MGSHIEFAETLVVSIHSGLLGDTCTVGKNKENCTNDHDKMKLRVEMDTDKFAT